MFQWLTPAVSNTNAPFPAKEKLGGANISQGKIEQIVELARAGNKIGVIAERLNVSRETVRRWLNRAKEANAESSPRREAGTRHATESGSDTRR